MNLTTKGLYLFAIEPERFIAGNSRANLETYLSETERHRYEKIREGQSRDHFLLGRFLLKTSLSRFEPSVDPKTWIFEIGTHGKPFLVGKFAKSLTFNLSHTDGMVLCAIINESCRLGVDTENMGRHRSFEELAKRYFSPSECDEFMKWEGVFQRRRFFDYWTLKESYLKATGQGISVSLSSFSFGLTEKKVVTLEAMLDDAGPWFFQQYQSNETHRIALAVCGLANKKPLVSIWAVDSMNEINPCSWELLRSTI